MDRDLTQVYWEAHGFEGIDLERFLDDVQAGVYGSFTATEIRGFLLKLEASIIENIEVKAAEAPGFAAAKDELIEETNLRFQRLRDRYAS